MSREKTIAFLKNIATAFANAPRQPVRGANPATTKAWTAEREFDSLRVRLFYSRVTTCPWCDEGHVALSYWDRWQGKWVEFFRAYRPWREWQVQKSSPLALALFGNGGLALQETRKTSKAVSAGAVATPVPA